MGFLVRPATAMDAASIAHVNITSWRLAYGHLLSAEFFAAITLESRAERWRHNLEVKKSVVHVLEVEGEVRGYAGGGAPFSADPPRDTELYMLYILESEYGLGGGQALLDAAIGDVPAYLWVAEDNPRALAFYRRNGFETDGVAKVEPAWENLAELRMVR